MSRPNAGSRSRTSTADVVDGLLGVSRALIAAAARSLAQLDEEVTLVQHRVLVILATEGPQRTSDLAQQLDVTSSTVTRMCDRLYRKRLVRRYRRADDRRAAWIALTPAGRDLIADIMRRRRATLVRLVRAVPERHRASMAAGLRAFVEATGEVAEAEWWRRWRTSADDDPLAVSG